MNEDLFEDLRIENSNLDPNLKKRYFTDKQFELMSETERFRVMGEGKAHWSQIAIGLEDYGVEGWQQLIPEHHRKQWEAVDYMVERLYRNTKVHPLIGITEENRHLLKTQSFQLRMFVILGQRYSRKLKPRFYLGIYNLAKEIDPELVKTESEFNPKIFSNAFPDPDDFLNAFKEFSPPVYKIINTTQRNLRDEYVLIAVCEALHKKVRSSTEKRQVKNKKTIKPLTIREDFLRNPVDPISRYIFGALKPGAMQKRADKEDQIEELLARGFTGVNTYTSLYPVNSEKGDFFGLIGYKNDVEETLWNCLQKQGASTLKAHIALFARAYAETDCTPGKFINLIISELLDDLQFTRKKNGSHKIETKERIFNILELLTKAQLQIMHRQINGKVHLLEGPIWQRGISSKTADLHSKQFKWEPDVFRYAPGDWFAFNDSRSVAYIHKGLLKLHSEKDKFAIFAGGYLSLIGRMHNYKPRPLLVSTLIDKTGIRATHEKYRQTGVMETKLIQALDSLGEAGVIKNWEWKRLEEAENELPHRLKTSVFLNRLIEIIYPDELSEVGKRNEDKKAKHFKSVKKNSVKNS